MKPKSFKRNNKGISTIIAAALIVAMTVVAAVALGATVLQIPTETQSIQQLTMSGTASVSTNEITLTHLGGDPIHTQSITFKTYIPAGSYEGYRYEIPTNTGLDKAVLDEYSEQLKESGLLMQAPYVLVENTGPYAAYYPVETPPAPLLLSKLPMHLQNDQWVLKAQMDYRDSYGMLYELYGYRYVDMTTGVYSCPIQAGDTLVLPFSQSFSLGQYDGPYSQWPYLYAPQIGQQFIVELYSGEQIITTVTITVQA